MATGTTALTGNAGVALTFFGPPTAVVEMGCSRMIGQRPGSQQLNDFISAIEISPEFVPLLEGIFINPNERSISALSF
jgi:hypothetical protein